MKRTIRLSESDLHKVIKECVNKILKEDIQTIPSTPEDFSGTHKVKEVFQTLERTGSAMVNITTPSGKVLSCELRKTGNGYLAKTNGYQRMSNNFSDMLSGLKEYCRNYGYSMNESEDEMILSGDYTEEEKAKKEKENRRKESAKKSAETKKQNKSKKEKEKENLFWAKQKKMGYKEIFDDEE